MILVLDFGSQTTQLIARRIREQNVYSEIVSFDGDLEKYRDRTEGIVLSGGPSSVYAGQAPHFPKGLLDWKVPILGICYGAQLLVHAQGGEVEPATAREFGRAPITLTKDDGLFESISKTKPQPVWMSHGDRIVTLPQDFEAIAVSENSPFAAIRSLAKRQYGVQFHPEVTHTPMGKALLHNFVFRICQAKADWKMANFINDQIEHVQSQVKDRGVVLGLSGGVDSFVVAALLYKALGDQLTAIFVDTGLLRANEREQVQATAKEHLKINLRVVDASARFLRALTGVTCPETKRKTIGKLFIDVFDEESRTLHDVGFLAQGTLYPDVIESTSFRGPSSKIKSHHNVGGLPKRMNLKLVEPLRELFKDEVRVLGLELGLPKEIVNRHPFPGPGLAVRILDDITPERVTTLQAADHIFINELKTSGLYGEVWQAFAVLLPVKSVGVMGDERTYENVCALRAVTSLDGMTADWAQLPHDFLARVSNRIINEVRGINRVVYDISSKPPATIEWE